MVMFKYQLKFNLLFKTTDARGRIYRDFEPDPFESEIIFTQSQAILRQIMFEHF